MSKIPPQLRQPVSALPESTTAFTFRHLIRALRPLESLENLLPARQHFVQRFLKIRRALCELLSDLRNILLKALFYLLSKELLQGSVAQTFRVLGRMVGDDVRDKRSREALRTLVGVFGKKWIKRAPSACVSDNA